MEESSELMLQVNSKRKKISNSEIETELHSDLKEAQMRDMTARILANLNIFICIHIFFRKNIVDLFK